jgi:tripartite-type tricarboxylate transporter receptor subunit TctC
MKPLRLPALIAIVMLAATLAPVTSHAQAWPTKPIRVIVPYPPGGLFDAIFRPLARELGEALGQPIVLDNRPGANTIIGMELCAKAAADGYTICATSNDSMVLNQYLYSKLPYDAERDFAPVTNLLFTEEIIVANGKVPFNTFPEMLAYAKANPGTLNFGSFGLGSSSHMILAWINNRAGVNITHVPYRGGGPSVAATVAGEVELCYMGIGALYPHIRAGRVKALAVAQPTRSPLLPEVPTMAEQGMEFPLKPWVAVIAPAGTPKPIVARLSSEIARIIHSPRYRDEYLLKQGLEPIGDTPEQFAEFLKSERATGSMLVKLSGLRLEN